MCVERERERERDARKTTSIYMYTSATNTLSSFYHQSIYMPGVVKSGHKVPRHVFTWVVGSMPPKIKITNSSTRVIKSYGPTAKFPGHQSISFFLHTFDKNWQMMTSHHYCITYDVILIANMAFQVLFRRQNTIQRRDRIFRDRTRPLDIYDDQDLIRRSCLGRVYLIWGIFCMTIYNHPQQDHIAYQQLYKFLQRWDTMLQDHFSRL